MEIEEALTTYLLKTNSGIEQKRLTALSPLRSAIANAVDPPTYRFYWENAPGQEMPEGQMPKPEPLPYIVAQDVSDIPIYTLTGISEFAEPVYQFIAYANLKPDAKALGKQISTALTDFTGSMSGIQVEHIRLLNELCSTAVIIPGKLYNYVFLEFQVRYIRSE